MKCTFLYFKEPGHSRARKNETANCDVCTEKIRETSAICIDET